MLEAIAALRGLRKESLDPDLRERILSQLA